MNVNRVFEIMGGREAVLGLTRLTKGRLSQWVKDDSIPRAWLMLFHQMHPDEIPHPDIWPELATPAQEPTHV